MRCFEPGNHLSCTHRLPSYKWLWSFFRHHYSNSLSVWCIAVLVSWVDDSLSCAQSRLSCLYPPCLAQSQNIMLYSFISFEIFAHLPCSYMVRTFHVASLVGPLVERIFRRLASLRIWLSGFMPPGGLDPWLWVPNVDLSIVCVSVIHFVFIVVGD